MCRNFIYLSFTLPKTWWSVIGLFVCCENCLSVIKSKILFFSLVFFIAGCIFSCKKDTRDVVPNAYVNLFIDTTYPEFVNLNAVGGWVYITGGSRGIVVYRNSIEEFMAYDRHCTYEPSNSCARIEVEQSNITTVDSCCGSKFVLTDGSVINGPASMPLKQYQAKLEGNTLRIFN